MCMLLSLCLLCKALTRREQVADEVGLALADTNFAHKMQGREYTDCTVSQAESLQLRGKPTSFCVSCNDSQCRNKLSSFSLEHGNRACTLSPKPCCAEELGIFNMCG